VFIALVATAASVLCGAVLTMMGAARPTVLLPLRSFAMAALLTSVLLHLLPEAVAEAGGWTLIAFVAGVILPNALTVLARPNARQRGHNTVIMVFGLGGVLLHQLGDGIALGAFSSGQHASHVHWDLVLGIAAHTVPLTAVLALRARNPKSIAVVAAMMIAAAALGMIIATTSAGELAIKWLPWVTAVVAGLLLHILAHDSPMVNRSVSVRSVETAVLAGVAMPMLLTTSHAEHDHAAASVINIAERLGAWALWTLPVVTLGIVAIAAIGIVARRQQRPLSTSNALGATFAEFITGAPCSCDAPTRAPMLATRSGWFAACLFLFAGPVLAPDALVLGWSTFGWQLAMIRVGVIVIVALLAARLMSNSTPKRFDATQDGSIEPVSAFSLDELLVHRGPWIIAGIIVAAFLDLALEGRGSALFASNTTAIFAMLGIGAVSYVCASAAAPIAACLMIHGLSPAAALGWIMFGACTNISTLRTIYNISKAAVPLLIVVSLAVIVPVMLLVSRVFEPIVISRIAPFADAAIWRIVVAAIFVALMLRSLWRFGLGAWLEPIVGNDHGHDHHQHADDEPCGEGCHSHDAHSPTNTASQDHEHDRAHDHHHAHDTDHSSHRHS
jgi:uncharacterized membrane protein YraQ (UPF0718 family)